MGLISSCHIIYVSILFVSSDLMIYKYNSYTSNTYFLIDIPLCYTETNTTYDLRQIIHIYLHIDTHIQLPNCKTLSFRLLTCSGWYPMQKSAERKCN